MQGEFSDSMKSLIALVADKNMEFLMRGLLPRISNIEEVVAFSFDVIVHPYRDPGIFNEADDFLRSFQKKYDFALTILDHSGCGREDKSRESIENIIEEKLARSGWNNRSCAIVIQPELENWIWVNEVRMANAISWEKEIGLNDWLVQNNWKSLSEIKPKQPKEAFEAAIKTCNTPRSSSLYFEIAKSASYKECQDRAFLKLICKVKDWFGHDKP